MLLQMKLPVGLPVIIQAHGPQIEHGVYQRFVILRAILHKCQKPGCVSGEVALAAEFSSCYRPVSSNETKTYEVEIFHNVLAI